MLDLNRVIQGFCVIGHTKLSKGINAQSRFLGVVKQVLMLTGVGLLSRWLSLARWTDFNSGPEFWGNEA